MSVIGSNILAGASGQAVGYNVERSLRFNSSDSAYLSRTPASAGNRKTWTWAGWVKRSGLSAAAGDNKTLFIAGSNAFVMRLDANDGSNRMEIYNYNGSAYDYQLITAQVFRDLSAWFHVAFVSDTDNATAGDRLRLYINGSRITQFSTATYPSSGFSAGAVNNSVGHRIGSTDATDNLFSGYLAECYLIDGQALDPSSFTEVSATTGQLIPKAYSGPTPTGNSSWLPFSDNSAATATTLGKDNFNLGNNWTPNNLSVTAGAGNDSLVDTPTSYGTDDSLGGSVRGNYAILNPVAKTAGQTPTLTNGNLDFAGVVADAYTNAVSSIAVNSGKWYVEYTVGTLGTANGLGFVNAASLSSVGSGWGIGEASDGWLRVIGGVSNNSSISGSYGTIQANDVVMLALDLDAGKAWWGRNGTWENSGNPANGTNQMVTFTPGGKSFCIGPSGYSASVSITGSCNFGQRPFAYTAPSGFKALCDTNLPAPVVAKPSEVMDVKLYTGNGSTQTISGLGFSPDFVWIKCRSAANTHALVDSIRGVTKYLVSASTAAEVTDSGGITSLNSDGFSLTFPTTNAPTINANSATYAAWTWDAGSSTVTNTQGSITSSVRANASAGFSIVTFTGPVSTSTVGHGLGVAPSMIILKNRDQGGAGYRWCVYHQSIGNTKALFLDGTNAESTSSGYWNNTTPTSTVFSVGGAIITGAEKMVAYCFAPVAGYSNGFSYTGNGSTDGSFVYLGFRPRLILLKCSSTTGNWTLLDTAREGYNVDNDPLYPNLSNAEGTTDLLDITSNGFKLRTTDASVNSSGATYVGYAWAEAPFAYSRAR